MHQLIDQGQRAGKCPGLLHIGVHRDGGKILRHNRKVRLHQRVAEAEDTEHGVIDILFPRAEEGNLLLRRQLHLLLPVLLHAGNQHHLFYLAKLVGRLFDGHVLLGKLAVLIQNLAAGQADLLSLRAFDAKLQISRQVLTEIQHLFPRWRSEKLCGKPFLLLRQHIVPGRGYDLLFCLHRLPTVGRRHGSVHNLPVLQIGKADRAVIAPGKAAVA